MAEFFDGQGPFFAPPQVRGLPHGRFCEFGGIPSVEMPDVGGWEDDNRRGRRWASEAQEPTPAKTSLCPPSGGRSREYRLAKDGDSQTCSSTLRVPSPAGSGRGPLQDEGLISLANFRLV